MIGEKFNRLTVLDASICVGRRYYADCKCDCGAAARVELSKLKTGHTKSCGCLQRELIAQKQTVHGHYYEAEHQAWVNMQKRCTDARWAKWYANISVCPRWLVYDNFLADVGRKPTPKHTLDRIDSTKNYTPENVRWAGRATQSRNTKNHETNISGARGVSWSEVKNKWRATIYVDNKQKHIGYFLTITDASSARQHAEDKYWKHLNETTRPMESQAESS